MSSSKTMICFNTECKEAKPDQFGKGWRLRNGSFCQLCHRCAAAFEEGKFCDTFHLDTAGWRNCESCGKRIHCGCVVSMYAYILLDAGGVDCMACASKNIILATNQVWPPSSSLSLPVPDGLKDLLVKSWTPIAPHPSKNLVHWPPMFNIRNASAAHSPLNPRIQYDIDRIKHAAAECPVPIFEKKRLEDQLDRMNNLSHALMDRVTNENATTGMVTGSQSLGRDEISFDGLQGMTYQSHPSACVNNSFQPASSKEDPSNSQFAALPCSLSNEANGLSSSVSQSREQTALLPAPKHFNASLQNGMDLSGETPKGNGRLQVDARGRSQLLPRYWPKITDQELQQISGDSNSVVTPLFEKMLSASDAGRVGRLVLPKKCAEAYFPTITQSDGVPITVQDAKGKEWVLHFRFWPNNNSRMYVLEGVTPCIQSMQLQAGDTVTFSRIDPEGKLVMGFRKAGSMPPSDQGKRSTKTGADVSKKPEVINAESAGSWRTNDKSGCISKHVGGSKSSSPPVKRKGRCLSAKSKRLRIDHEDILELMLTLEKTQVLFRPPPDHNPDVTEVDDCAIEEYEEAPIFGKPTIYTTDEFGEKVQWAQCEDCSKWRKLPIGAFLPSRWTCSANIWDLKRSSCSSAQEVTSKHLEDIVASNRTESVSKRSKPTREDTDGAKPSKGVSILADLATPGENVTLLSSAQTSKHPRHRSGCTCIVCIQPPSGKPKHKDTCTCSVCLTLKRRKLTLMKRLSEKDTESARRKLEELQLPDNPELNDALPTIVASDPHQDVVANESSENDPGMKKPHAPISSPIDLNIRPEREDVPLSAVSYSNSMVRLVSGNHKLFPRPHRATSSTNDGNVVNDPEASEGGHGDVGAGCELDVGVQHSTSLGTGNGSPDVLCLSKSSSTPACG